VMPLLILLSSILSMAMALECENGEEEKSGAGADNCWPLPWVQRTSGSIPRAF
jgi:hypothetical protein